jgi:hypothetical protein
MKMWSERPDALDLLHHRDGVPDTMVVDGAAEFVENPYKKKARRAGSHFKQTELYSPWQNAAEGTIRELKKGSGRKLIVAKSPKRLWDDCLELEAYIKSHSAHDIYGLKGEVPETIMMGQTPDISPFAEYEWYQWVKYYDETSKYPHDRYVLGKYLGPSLDLKQNGNYSRHTSSFRSLTPDELANPKEQDSMRDFEANIEKVLGPAAKLEDFDEELDIETPQYDEYKDDHGGGTTMTPDREDPPHEHYDVYANAQVLLPHQGKMLTGKVKSRKRDHDSSLHGTANEHPILDTRTYVVEFPDGAEAEYAANAIAENMYAQCDARGNQYLLLDSIVAHKSDETAIREGHGVYDMIHGRKHWKKMTKGWHLCVLWKDRTTTWEQLAALKESNPVEVAKYAVTTEIYTEPAFHWWVTFTIKKRNIIISAVTSRYHKRTHKFGIEVPKSIADAVRLDKENGNRLWQDGLDKEMNDVRVAFDMHDDDQEIPVGYQMIRTHIIWDVKMEDFRRKARCVAGGHMTEVPSTITYASVVSRELVRIALTLAALKDLQVKTADIQNAYLCSPCSEKVWTICGAEFWPDHGCKAIIVRALYDLRSAGALF